MKFLDELSGIVSGFELKANAEEWQAEKKKFAEAFPSWKE